MDDTDDDDARYPYAHAHTHNHTPPMQYHQYPPSYINTTTHNPNPPFHRPKLPLRTAPYSTPTPAFDDEDDEDNNNYDDEDEDDSSENHFPEPQQSDTRGKLPQESEDVKPVFDRFGVRTPTPKFFAHKDPAEDWSETATLILLDSWREKFLQCGRRSLRAEQWVEIAKRVSAASKTLRTDAHCRNRFQTLKKKYKREKLKQNRGFGVSTWTYFRHMDSLVSPPQSQVGLHCGVDGGEYVFLNPRVYLAQSSCDDFSDTPAEDDDVDEEDGGVKRFRESDDEDCFRVLADSIKRFGEIYERIESNKRQGMLELEKMRKEIDGDLEAQKSQILEQTKVALAKIRQGGENANNDDDIDASVTNMSG